MLSLIAGCSPSGAISDYCVVDNLITVSDADILTHETKLEILDHDQVYQKLCKGTL